MVNGQTLPKNAMRSIMIATLSSFGAKTKIALTGVRIRVRESLAL